MLTLKSRRMKSTGAFVLLALLFAAPSHSQVCTDQVAQVQADVWDLKQAVSLAVRQYLEKAVNGRVKETFDPVTNPDGSFLCATSASAVSLPINEVDGIPDGVSGPARCALYCRNLDGCISFNYYKKALVDGTQCQLFTAPPSACSSDANCQHYEATGAKRSCRSTTGFTFLPGTRTYYRPLFESLTWAEAQDKCHALNPFAHLAVFRSMAEFNELIAFLKTIQPNQVWTCATNAGYGSDWSGWWVAKRKLTDDAKDFNACKAAPMVQALDTKVTQVIPEEPWESQMNLGGAPDCSASYRKAFQWEMCMSIPVNHGYQLNDIMCDYKLCALCQLDYS